MKNMETENHISRQEEQKHFLESEIEKLEEEIKTLEDEADLKERLSVGDFSTDILKTIASEFESSGCFKNQTQGDKSLDEKQMRLKIESMEALTGITFENCKLEKVEGNRVNGRDTSGEEENSISWRRQLSGKCYDLNFSVDFVVVESTVQDCSITSKEIKEELHDEYKARLTELNIIVSNPLATRELEPFIEKTKREKGLCPFFQVFMQYGSWYQHRAKTFKHFKSKYPHIVHLISGKQCSTIMQLINPTEPEHVFTITWQISVSDIGTIRPEIDLYTYKAETRNQTKAGKSLPVYFRKMLSLFGIEQAFKMVVGIVIGKAS